MLLGEMPVEPFPVSITEEELLSLIEKHDRYPQFMEEPFQFQRENYSPSSGYFRERNP